MNQKKKKQSKICSALLSLATGKSDSLLVKHSYSSAHRIDSMMSQVCSKTISGNLASQFMDAILKYQMES